MAAPWEDWDHIVKIDPDKSLVEGETFGDICQTGTDAIAVGGTTGMTQEKMKRVISACSEHDVPLYLEPSTPEVVVDSSDLDGYLVPTVLNAGDQFWVTGAHKEWARLNPDFDWDRMTTEAYIVLNPDSAVAEYTQADCGIGVDHVVGYVTIAEEFFNQEIVYIEYSGMLGDPEIVEAAAEASDSATLFYGGGICDYETAEQMSQYADVVIVGDLAHEKGADAVAETVRGSKAGKQQQH
ncbi:putative phosphoglycerol geranylgeranyltransferase [Salinarchaeum sp. IM2453]|uniref:phosphoglycerol geranylgeranyltransferase n=1 Tax=Salinarchaeum sp. IM2453 TaxID=2862870 RepID=UPI001C83D446|nr:putative phosphoglycerol geranylgeranyltransferase [Salinarchaeum sp. IM2453]QZA89153.1 putative phosphoglycerol geranylgeranyltransferase [Salinarchaeum sp. IM2453]